MSDRLHIPAHGQETEEVLGRMAGFRDGDARYAQGRTWSLVYHVDEAHQAFLERAHTLYQAENFLNPMAFPSLHRMEREVVQMTASMLNGPPSCVGTMTSGGTESILLAVKTARDRARAVRPWIVRPNLVIPDTAHVAFDKGGHLFGVRVRRARTDGDGRADLRALRRRIDRNTVLIAASAPQYPTGAVDPIPEIAALGLKKGIPVHVDACFGGFILPWLERLGVALPPWDFRVAGVTSMSADVHKYGYGAKGASVVLYRDMDLMRHQFFVTTDWAGGIYASPTLPGTRPGGPIAAAWASLVHLGEDGYVALARRCWEAAERLRAGIAAIPELRVLGTPHATIVAWASATPDVDVYAVADRMEERGWTVDRQQKPPSVHCSAGPVHVAVVDEYLADLRAAVAEVRGRPEASKEGAAAMYGMMARIPLRGAVHREVRKLMERMYGTEGTLPDLGEEPDGAADLARRALDAWDRLRGRWTGRGRP